MHIPLLWSVISLVLLLMLWRPWEIAEAWWGAGGALALILLGLLPLRDAAHAIGKGTNVYLFLTGMMAALRTRPRAWSLLLVCRAHRRPGSRLSRPPLHPHLWRRRSRYGVDVQRCHRRRHDARRAGRGEGKRSRQGRRAAAVPLRLRDGRQRRQLSATHRQSGEPCRLFQRRACRPSASGSRASCCLRSPPSR